MSEPIRRLRRLRYPPTLREMLAKVRLDATDLIAPVFVRAGAGVANEIPSMPGQFQFSVDRAVEAVAGWAADGVRAVIVFGVTEPDAKDELGTQAWQPDAPVQQFLRRAKAELPDLLLLADTCLCEYTSHGHCGPLSSDGAAIVDNDAALACLAKTAVSQAAAGANLVAPSAMMDGQVAAIRSALDADDRTRTGILSYAVKYASSLYGPFRDAAESPPAAGDRRSHQMDCRAPRQEFAEAELDLAEGADILMVKPAGAYLDVLARLRDRLDAPLAAYQVSGEYAMLKAAAANGWLDERAVVLETLTAARRAGADLIVTYYAADVARWLAKG